jgi:DNA-binding beta-propeller fold protein YncE
VYVTGNSTDATTTSYATIAYNASTGAQVWLERYDGGGATSLVASGAKVYVTGQAGGAFTTVAYDASTGSQQWVTRYQASAAQPNGIVLSPDETKVYITGGEYDGALTQVYDTSDGHGLGGNIYKSAITNALAISPDGTRLFVTGQKVPGDGYTAAYNAVEYP